MTNQTTLTTPPRHRNLLWWGGLFAIFGVFVFFCSLQWKEPTIEDEFFQFKYKPLWFEKGADPGEFSHTPLYHEATSLWQRLLGKADPDRPESIWILRSFGVFTSILTALILLWGLSKKEYKPDRLQSMPLLVVALLLWQPFCVQYSIHLDYDSTLLVPLLLLSVILIERWDQQQKPSWHITLLIGFVLGLALFAKELTPLIIIAAWPFWALTRRWRVAGRSWLRPTIQATLGGLLALFTLYALLQAWGHIRGFNWYEPLLITKDKVFSGGHVSGAKPWTKWGWPRFLFLGYTPWIWFGIPTLFLFFKIRAPGRFQITRIPFSIWMTLAIFAAYTWIVQVAYYFAKYNAPAWPIFIYGISSYLMAPTSRALQPSRRLGIALLCLALIFVGYSPEFDPLLIIEYRKHFLGWPMVMHVLSLLIPIALLTLILKWSGKSKVFFGLLGLILYLLGIIVGHTQRTYQKRDLYGEWGFQESLRAVALLKSKVSPQEPITVLSLDLEFALRPDQAVFFDMESYQPGKTTWPAKIILSRTYGDYSIASNPTARAEIEKTFPCHQIIQVPKRSFGQIAHIPRYEWWWKPLPEATCKD